MDFKAGALNSEYFRARVQEVADAIHQFEKSSMPTGWVCKWNATRYVSTCTGWICCCIAVYLLLIFETVKSPAEQRKTSWLAGYVGCSYFVLLSVHMSYSYRPGS